MASSNTVSTLSDIASVVTGARKGYDKLTTPSLTAFTKQANVMSRLYIEDSILRDDICVPLVGTLNQLYVSYILAALNLDTQCANGRTVREMFELVATENFDIIDEIMQNFGKTGLAYSNEETVVQLEPNTQRLPVGRIIELSMNGVHVLKKTEERNVIQSMQVSKTDKTRVNTMHPVAVNERREEELYQFKAYLYVQLIPYVLTPDVVEGYITANFDPPVSKRWTKYKAGEISFWRDFILAHDLIKKQRKILKQDKHGVIIDMLNHQHSSLYRWWEGTIHTAFGYFGIDLPIKSVSHNLANTILVASKATFDRACRENGINFSNNTQRQKFFNKTWSMIICVVDPLYNTIEMYFNGVDVKGTYSFNMINKVGAKGQDNFDLKEVMSAFSQGLTPKF